MSEHSLPSDSSKWPRDPFRLLGVQPGISARDLRRAYLQLIRRYKPEHAPNEFRLIREAYEKAQRFTEVMGSHWRIVEPPDPTEEDSSPNPEDSSRNGEQDGPASSGSGRTSTVDRSNEEPGEEDFWELACTGQIEAS